MSKETISIGTYISNKAEVRISETKNKPTWLEEHFDKPARDQIRLSIVMLSVSSIVSLILKVLYIIQESGFELEYLISQVYPLIIGSLPVVIGFFKFIFNLLNIVEIPVYGWKLVKFIKIRWRKENGDYRAEYNRLHESSRETSWK